jgi:hypothetical protein
MAMRQRERQQAATLKERQQPPTGSVF